MAGGMLGPYRIGRELGAGGMGTVYAATAHEPVEGLAPGAAVALKVVHPHLLATPGFFDRFLLEAQIGRAVDHPNVVRTLDAAADGAGEDRRHYLVMEYVDGQTLRDLVEELGRVPEELCRHVGREVARGLAAIHDAGAVHRDLKPENVLITPEHEIKVMDLGVACLADQALRLSETGMFVGSVEYAAPEQFRGGDLDARADLHTLGVLLYELASGVHPFRADDFPAVMRRVLDEEPARLGSVHPQISPFFEEVVQTLLAKDRALRIPSAGECETVLGDGEGGPWWLERSRVLRTAARQPLRRIRIPRETALHGRDEELAALGRLYESAATGQGRVLLLEGEAGVGKSRLVDEFVQALRAEGEDVNFLYGSYPPGGAATAEGAFSSAYREQFGTDGLERTLGERLPDTPRLVPAFAAMLRGDAPPPGTERLSRQSLQAVFASVTHSLAADRPTIVLIDDLHFAPEDGRALFASLSSAVLDHRILLVGTMRPGVPERWTASLERHDHVTRLALGRLRPADLEGLLTEAFASERLAQDLARKIGEKSDGNPFFVFEIIRGLRDASLIKRGRDGSWIGTAVIEEFDVPGTVRDLVHARIADLSESERELLEAAACAGYEFDAGILADALGLGAIPALRMLGRIERNHRLVRSVGAVFAFDHHQVQEALHGGLSEPLRKEYHLALGDALARRVRDAPSGRDAVTLCEHYLAGGAASRALPRLDAAVTHLVQGLVHDGAARLIRAALRVPGLLEGRERYDFLMREVDALKMAGRNEEMHGAIEEAMLIATAIDDPACIVDAHVEFSRDHHRAGDRENGEEHAHRALEIADSHALVAQQISARANVAQWTFRAGRAEEAGRLYTEAIELAGDDGPSKLVVECRFGLGNVHAYLRRLDEARAAYLSTREVVPAEVRVANDAVITGALGRIAHIEGHWEESLDLYEESHAVARAAGHRHQQMHALDWIARLLVLLGQNDRGEAVLEATRVMTRQLGAGYVAAYQVCMEGVIAAARGDTDRAEELFIASTERHRAIGNPEGSIEPITHLAAQKHRLGQRDDALALFTESREIARRIGAAQVVTYCDIYLGLLPGGDPDAARSGMANFGSYAYPSFIECSYVLWGATGEIDYLRNARRVLQHLVDHAPEDCKESLVRDTIYFPHVERAWRLHGGSLDEL